MLSSQKAPSYEAATAVEWCQLHMVRVQGPHLHMLPSCKPLCFVLAHWLGSDPHWKAPGLKGGE